MTAPAASPQPYATPLVRSLAEKFDVDLAKVGGTGTGGRITADDVRKAAGRPTAAEAAAQARSAAPTLAAIPHATSLQPSVWVGGLKVAVDAYAKNPLVDDARQSQPMVVRLATSEASPPTLFANGDLPIITSSLVDPQVLMRLPWQARHPAMEAKDAAALAQILEDYAGEPDLAVMDFGGHRGNQDYKARVSDWLSGVGVDRTAPASPAQQALRDAASEETYVYLFGAEDARKAQAAADAKAQSDARAKFEAEEMARAEARAEHARNPRPLGPLA